MQWFGTFMDWLTPPCPLREGDAEDGIVVFLFFLLVLGNLEDLEVLDYLVVSRAPSLRGLGESGQG